MSEDDKKKDIDPVEVITNLKDRKAESREKKPEKEAASEDEAKPESLAAVIREHANEGEEPLSRNFTLGKILGGDILNAEPIRRRLPIRAAAVQNLE